MRFLCQRRDVGTIQKDPPDDLRLLLLTSQEKRPEGPSKLYQRNGKRLKCSPGSEDRLFTNEPLFFKSIFKAPGKSCHPPEIVPIGSALKYFSSTKTLLSDVKCVALYRSKQRSKDPQPAITTCLGEVSNRGPDYAVESVVLESLVLCSSKPVHSKFLIHFGNDIHSYPHRSMEPLNFLLNDNLFINYTY